MKEIQEILHKMLYLSAKHTRRVQTTSTSKMKHVLQKMLKDLMFHKNSPHLDPYSTHFFNTPTHVTAA